MAFRNIALLSLLLSFSCFYSQSQTLDARDNLLIKKLLNTEETSLNFLADDFETLVDGSDSCKQRNPLVKESFYYFLPSLKANLHNVGDESSFENYCFAKNKVTFRSFDPKEKKILLVFELSKKKSLFCKQTVIINTSTIHTFSMFFFEGRHEIVIKNITDDDLLDIKVNGLRIMNFCSNFFETMKSFGQSLLLYLGGMGSNPKSLLPFLRPNVPKYMENANVDFMNDYVGFKQIPRGQFGKNILKLDKNEIKTGDFIIINRYDGVDPLIMMGTGSHVGHTCVAAWIDGELYILESQDGWYWPKRGIQRNKWEQWVEWAHNADFNVAFLPLKDEWRAKLNVEKALEFFYSIEGHPYGYHNFIYSWIDTKDKNLPKFFDTEAVLLAFTVLEKIAKGVTDMMLTEGLNLRLGTKGLSLPQIVIEAAKRNIKFEEVLAIPEKEGWEYSDGVNYVCSCFVVAFYKHGGMFGDLEIEPNEFTPKDVYNLNIFDAEYKKPQVCEEADPDLPYCQIMGRYKLTLTNYSTIEPYSHMNERCSSQAPEFIREDGC